MHWLKGKGILAVVVIIALIALGYYFLYYDVEGKSIAELAAIKAKYGLQKFELPSNENDLISLKTDLTAFKDRLLSGSSSKELGILTSYVSAELKLAEAEQKSILAGSRLSEENIKACNETELIQGSSLIIQAVSLEKEALSLLSSIQESKSFQKIQGITAEQVREMIARNNSRLQGIESLKKMYC